MHRCIIPYPPAALSRSGSITDSSPADNQLSSLWCLHETRNVNNCERLTKFMFPILRKVAVAVPAFVEEHVLQPTGQLSPADEALQGQPWTKTLILDDSTLQKASEDESMNKPLFMRYHRSGSIETDFLSTGIDSHATDVHRGISVSEDGRTPREPYSYFPVISLRGPKRIFWLALLAFVIIPVVSAENPILYVDGAVWAFGILANVPSIYVLANPYLSASGDISSKDIIWTIARAW